jgi:hypothetical protein
MSPSGLVTLISMGSRSKQSLCLMEQSHSILVSLSRGWPLEVEANHKIMYLRPTKCNPDLSLRIASRWLLIKSIRVDTCRFDLHSSNNTGLLQILIAKLLHQHMAKLLRLLSFLLSEISELLLSWPCCLLLRWGFDFPVRLRRYVPCRSDLSWLLSTSASPGDDDAAMLSFNCCCCWAPLTSETRRSFKRGSMVRLSSNRPAATRQLS